VARFAVWHHCDLRKTHLLPGSPQKGGQNPGFETVLMHTILPYQNFDFLSDAYKALRVLSTFRSPPTSLQVFPCLPRIARLWTSGNGNCGCVMELMRRFLTRVFPCLIHAQQWYLRKEGTFAIRRKNRTNTYFQEVFHPGLFYSTQFLVVFGAQPTP